MKSRLMAKLKRWWRRMENRQQREKLLRWYEGGLLTPRETWGALKGWEGARSGAEYVNLDGSGNLEVV